MTSVVPGGQLRPVGGLRSKLARFRIDRWLAWLAKITAM